jgi:TolB-like protein
MVGIGAALAAILALAVYLGMHRGSGSTPVSARAMLAVLPLDNLSAEPGQEYFSDGLTEEIITELGRLNPERLGVIARTSVMRYKKTQRGIDQIGQELGVNYVLEGSVRKQADQVRVAVQLIRVSDQTHLWAASYDKNSRDVLGLQAEVAQALSRAIEIKLTPDGAAHLARTATVNHEAHDAYLMGRYFWNRRTSGTLEGAISYFEKAIQIDPNYALAYAGLADCYAVLPNYSNVSDREAELKTEMTATRALQLDPKLGEVYATLAIVSEARWDWAEAERRLKQAIQLSPNYATTHQWYADYLQQIGRLDEASPELKKAQELDPLSVITKAFTAYQLYLERRYDEAIAQSKKVVEMEPTRTDFRNQLGQIFVAKGMRNEAIVEFRKAREISPNDPRPIGLLGAIYARSGQRYLARKELKELDDLAKRGIRHAMFYSALIHLDLGEKEQGFELLNRAVDEHIGDIGWLKVSPAIDYLRSDPRYDQLLKRMNFPTN